MSWHINALEIHLMKMRCACVVPLGGWSLTCTSGAGKRQSSVDAWWKSWMPTRPLVGKLMKSYSIRCLILWRAGNDTSAKSWRSLEFELWHEDQESSLSQVVAKWRLIDSNHNDDVFLEWGWLFIFAHSARNNKRWHKTDGTTDPPETSTAEFVPLPIQVWYVAECGSASFAPVPWLLCSASCGVRKRARSRLFEGDTKILCWRNYLLRPFAGVVNIYIYMYDIHM